ncbi:MAG: DUF3298 and DUF4163 domain-containing protein [Clostridiaceae bacterium]|nr:DUF3298 and DUF4163 domain-containing protein [Clostridiaceae bacterium]
MMWERGNIKVVERKLIRHRIGLTYPDVVGLKNQEAEVKINGIIQEEIYKMIVEQGYEEDYTKEIWGEYEVKLIDEEVLSILLYIYSYSKGAAHGMTALKAINVSLEKGEVYELQDLFIKNSGYIETINEIVKEEIHQRDIPLLVAFETIDKKQDFYLTSEALVVFFQLYEYTPYVYGIPKFSIPYRVLVDKIDEVSPLNHLIK